MQKIKNSTAKGLALMLSPIILFIIIYSLNSGKSLNLTFYLVIIAYVIVVGVVSEIYSKFNKNGLYLLSDAIVFKEKKSELKIGWKDIKICSEVSSRLGLYIEIRSAMNPEINIKLYIDWMSRNSVFQLTQKYVPKNNILYDRISVYAKSKNITFKEIDS